MTTRSAGTNPTRISVYIVLQNFKFEKMLFVFALTPLFSLCYLYLNKQTKNHIWVITHRDTLFFILSGETISWVIGHTTLPPFLALVSEIFMLQNSEMSDLPKTIENLFSYIDLLLVIFPTFEFVCFNFFHY